MVRAIIADAGGVLVHLADDSGQRKWSARLGLGERELRRAILRSPEADRAARGELAEAEVWAGVAGRFGLDDAQLAELRHDTFAGERLDEDLAAFLRALRPRYRTAILTNAWRGARGALIGRFAIDAIVDELIVSAEEGLAKPDPRIYHLAAARLGVRPEEAVFVDDSAANVEGARAVGMRAILHKDAASTIAEVERLLRQ